MSTTSRRITIFEGCDGTGKTTAAKRYAELTDARYVHLPAMPRIKLGLPRMYVEVMLPAILGYQDIVLDRSWLSEVPYGTVYRDGQNRVGCVAERMLERLALRCGAVVVRCDPGWELVRESFEKRKGLEMLDSLEQLQAVYNLYQGMTTELPTLDYNYATSEDIEHAVNLERLRTPCHPLSSQSAGNLLAPTVLVGESFAERKEHDSFYQWPFASFSQEGCSYWLTQQLSANQVKETDLLWLNADHGLELLHDLRPRQVIAMGKNAAEELYRLKIMAHHVEHPQHRKRFGKGQPYDFFEHI